MYTLQHSGQYACTEGILPKRSINGLKISKISPTIFKFNPEELCSMSNIKIPTKAYIYYNTKPSKSDLDASKIVFI